MRVDMERKQPNKSYDGVRVTILLAISFVVGVYLIATAVLIARDGISYISYAKELNVEPLKIIRDGSGCIPEHYTPGYPLIILTIHSLISLFYKSPSTLCWIYSAQIAALLCKLLVLVPLYFIGRMLVGSKISFLALLILVILPYPAKFGSDALRDWPHLLFLASGFFLLLWGAKREKWWAFGAVGFVTGLGYLIRPICVQLIVYGVLWLLFSLFWSVRNMGRGKIVLALVLLLIGFIVPTGPYMIVKGEIIPERLRLIIKSFSRSPVSNETQGRAVDMPVETHYMVRVTPLSIAEGFGKLVNRVAETLMYFFVPPLLIGLCYRYRKLPTKVEDFFMIVFVLMNVTMLLLRYCCPGSVLSRRYILPLVAFTIFYVPVGLQVMGTQIAKQFSNKTGQSWVRMKEPRLWFSTLLILGMIICMPKLLRPMRIDKKGYRAAAEWLHNNTSKDELIAVSDLRISFYAERRGVKIVGNKIPPGVRFVVRKSEAYRKEPPPTGKLQQEQSFYLNKWEKKSKLVIYRVI
jgi:hypothetical protein